MNNKYINIIVHSYYTFLKSTLSIDDIIQFAIDQNLEYASLVDINVLYGAMEFYKKCNQSNIKPIIGLQIKYKNSDLVLIAKNYDGYKKLITISSLVMTTGLDDLNNYIDNNLYLINLNGDYIWNSDNFFTVKPMQNNSIAAKEIFYSDHDSYKISLILDAIKNEKKLDCQNPFIKKLENKMLLPNEFETEFDSNAINNLIKMINNINIVFPKFYDINIIEYKNNFNLSSKDYLTQITHNNLQKYLLNNST